MITIHMMHKIVEYYYVLFMPPFFLFQSYSNLCISFSHSFSFFNISILFTNTVANVSFYFIFSFSFLFFFISQMQLLMYVLWRNHNSLKNYYYIYPDIKETIGKRQRKKIEDNIITIYKYSNIDEFIEKCREDENDSDICKLIRNDSVEEFVTYVQKKNYLLSSNIAHSIFETNRFLIERKETSLIEYASFYGSIQIIQYLEANNIELSPTMWQYSVHSNDPEMIHYLERNKVNPPEDTYKLCLAEAIKWYHQEIARYIQANYINEDVDENQGDEISAEEYNLRACLNPFRYFNPEFLPQNFYEDKFIMLYLCEYNYTDFVRLLLESKNLNLNLNVKKCCRNEILNCVKKQTPFTIA